MQKNTSKYKDPINLWETKNLKAKYFDISSKTWEKEDMKKYIASPWSIGTSKLNKTKWSFNENTKLEDKNFIDNINELIARDALTNFVPKLPTL